MNSLVEKLSLSRQILLMAVVGITGIGSTAAAGLMVTDGSRVHWIVAGALAFSAFLLLLAVYLGRFSAARAEWIIGVLDAMARGDMKRRAPLSGRDEFAWMSWKLAEVCKTVSDTIGEIQEHAGQLSSAARELAEVTDQSRDRVHQQGEQTADLSDSMKEMSAMIQAIAEEIDSTAQEAREADHLAKAGQGEFEETLQSVENLTRNIEVVARVIERLREDSQAIDGVMEVIQTIAEQTNLLALNAAIEAARAGEQGRGFAVVADEVRTLANRTQESTREIQDVIDRLQQAAAQAVEAIESSRREAAVSDECARRAGASLEKILASVDRISKRCDQIAASAKEQTSTAAEINDNVDAIHTLTGHAASGADQTAVSSERLTRMAADLQGQVARFRLN